VVVDYSSSKEGADRIVDEIAKQGGKAIAVRANIARKVEIERLFAETKKAFGKLDILINNAGVYEFVPLEKITEEHFHKHFDVNVLGPLLATQEATRYFGSEGGSIINSARVPACQRLQSHEFIALQRQLSIQSPNPWQKSLDRARSPQRHQSRYF
jgi:3-oxoacyl-[acyl-carrier protein] reductase